MGGVRNPNQKWFGIKIIILIMTKKFFAVATFAFAMAFAVTAGAVNASDIYTPASGLLQVGSGMGAKAYQAPNVMAAQKALNACQNSNIAEDGKFGPITAGLFKTFQTAKGIKIDGIIGSQTAATLAACSGGVTTTPTTPTTTLSGGAGDLSVSDTSTDVEDTIKEGEEDVQVLGFKGEADGSDIAVTSIKVSLEETGGVASEDADDYFDEVSVWLNGKNVGSADIDDFSEDNDVYTKTISLSGAVVEEDEEEKFYVALTAAGTIDSDDIADGEWTVSVTTIRYNDATGAILSVDDGDLPSDTVVTLEDESSDDDLSIKSSTANPAVATLAVEEDESSDEFLIGAFKFDVDEDSSDITLNDFDVVIAIDDADDTGTDPDAVIDTIRVTVGGEDVDGDLTGDDLASGDGDATYNIDLDGEVTIDAGDDAEVKIYATFNDQDGNYGSGTTIQATVDGADVDAEGSDDLSADGSFTGKVHTLSVGTPIITLQSTPTLKLSSSVDAGPDVWVAEFQVTVNAPEDQDVFLPLDTFSFGTAGTSGVQYTVTGGATILSAVLEAEDSDIEEDDSYLVGEGESEDFTFSVYLEANDASGKVEVTSFWYETTDSVPNGTPEVTTGLTNFKTATKFLAE